MTADDPWRLQLEALGAFIRTQRQLAHLSLRELAQRTDVSNPYLSQIERGLHEPSVRVLSAIAKALNMSAETLLAQAGLLFGDHATTADRATDSSGGTIDTEAAIESDPRLTTEQKQALVVVYRSYIAGNSGAA